MSVFGYILLVNFGMDKIQSKEKENSKSEKQEDSQKRLSTFAGVFTPSLLTILGIILFLRLGYVTGSGGVARTLLILGLANVITILTSQSLAAIATNLKVKGGGDYYLISRTLGYKFGGAIGVVLYLAQSVSVAFYCIGFAEAFSAMFSRPLGIEPMWIAMAAVAVLFVLAWLGSDWATKFQYVVMVLLVAALASFFLGGLEQWQVNTFWANWMPPPEGGSFWIIFALFFPAVTGFTQGVSMSGDLKDPAKSLPLGTFLAVGVSIGVYLAVIIVFAGALPNKTLMENYQAIKDISRFGFLIDAGVIAATLSSAMASFMGGPRILQSLAADRIFPVLTLFAKGAGETGNPRRAILFTLCIALVTISLGQLNMVARVVSMFFLISYGLLNYATFYEADTDSPSFRPRFRWFNKYLSLAGCLICLMILLALDLRYGLVALLIILAIYLYLKHTAQPARWADSSRSRSLQIIRQQLLATTKSFEHDRDWRPNVIAFTASRKRREPLLICGNWIGGRSGLLTAVTFLEGERTRLIREKEEQEMELASDIKKLNLKGFARVVQCREIAEAIPVFLQSFGVGPLHANTALLNWYDDPARQIPGLASLQYGKNLRTIFRYNCNLVVLSVDESRWESLLKKNKQDLCIDVWWLGDNSSRLMLLFAYLMTQHGFWENAEVRVLTAGHGKDFREVQEELQKLLSDARIPGTPHVVETMTPEVILEHSTNSHFVFLPLTFQKMRVRDVHGYSFERTLPQLPTTLLVKAAEDIDLDAEPEEGAAGELAEAMDALHDQEKKLKKLKGEEAKNKERLENLKEKGTQGEMTRLLAEEVEQVEQEVEKKFRKVARETAKLEEAERRVRELGGVVDEN